MSYLEKRLSSLADDALDKINELSRRGRGRDQKAADNNGPRRQGDEELEALRGATPASPDPEQQFSAAQTTRQIGFQLNRRPFDGGIPFGGDSFSFSGRRPPPAIGFRTDLMGNKELQSRAGPAMEAGVRETGPMAADEPAGEIENEDDNAQEQQQQQSGTPAKRMCFFLPRIWFLMFFLCLMRLVLFVCKVYEDFQATKHYNLTGLTGHFLISAATLFLPTLVFTIYRIARYLQTRGAAPPPSGRQAALELEPLKQLGDGHSSAPATAQADDEGLVTARQTPTMVETFHDSLSQQEATIEVELGGGEGPAPQRPQRAQRHARLHASAKLENTTSDSAADSQRLEEQSVLIGVGEQLLHGALFVFWQLKRQVDVLSYLIGRACVWRAPTAQEDEELGRLQMDSDGLEWFQDFYAAFLAILTQVYSLGVYWFRDSVLELPKEAASDLGTPIANGTGFVTSSVNKVLAQTSKSLVFKDLIVISELIVSSAVVLSLLVVVRRRDDGPLTRALSSMGWGALFSARIIVISLAFVHLGWRLILPLTALHIVAIALWVYKISLDSHNDKPGERLHEAEWDDQVRAQVERADLELQQQPDSGTKKPKADLTQTNTSQWTISMHLVLLTQIFTLFAVPSLFYWPIMFNLRLHLRPLKYLLVVLIQNFLLISAIWYKLASATAGQLYLLGAVGALTIVGFIFVALYVALKPDFTEYFVRADMDFNGAEQAGVYYEFCSRVFRMPDLTKHSFNRLMKQEEREEPVETE